MTPEQMELQRDVKTVRDFLLHRQHAVFFAHKSGKTAVSANCSRALESLNRIEERLNQAGCLPADLHPEMLGDLAASLG